MRYKIETYNSKDKTTNTAEEVARYRLSETDYYSRGTEVTSDQMSNLIKFLPSLVGILEERGVLTSEDICNLFLVKAVETDP